MKIRPATAGDVDALSELAAASYRAAFLPIIGEDGMALRGPDFFAERFAAEWISVSVAEDDEGGIAGFAQVRAGTLDMLFVAPGRTGAGIGRKLLAHAESIGATRLECFRDNTAARRFYQRLGWRLESEYRRDFIGAERAFIAYAKP